MLLSFVILGKAGFGPCVFTRRLTSEVVLRRRRVERGR